MKNFVASIENQLITCQVAIQRAVGVLLAGLAFCAPLSADSLDVDEISRAAGVVATVSADGVVRISWARNDVAVEVDGVPLKPVAGLGSWAAFKATPHGAMMMGDEVVFEDEVSPAMDAAFAAGIEVTALHNHFFYDSPRVFFMHIGGTGEPESLAAGVKAIWDAIKRVRERNARPADGFPGRKPGSGQITANRLEQILDQPGQVQDGVVKFVFGRTGSVHGEQVGGSMGLTTWAAFTGSDEFAVVDGDFIMTAHEVQPVLKALRKHDIHVVALHNHMIGEDPSFYFTHYWGKGPAESLARALKTALEAQAELNGNSD